jgi:hypothetical protein
MRNTPLALTLTLTFAAAHVAYVDPVQAQPHHAQTQPHNTLSAEEVSAGWQLLFDGTTTDGWRGWRTDSFPSQGWVVEDGMLKSLGQKGGDIITTTTFTDFELSWEWRLSAKGNSGVKYFVTESRGTGGAIGHEYQMIDDDGYTEMELNHLQKTGGWYDVLPPTQAAARPIGEFNHSRIVVKGQTVEHWLNGSLVLRYDLGSADATAGIAASKFAKVEGFGTKFATPILLQDHNTLAWFRNLKIRDLTGS